MKKLNEMTEAEIGDAIDAANRAWVSMLLEPDQKTLTDLSDEAMCFLYLKLKGLAGEQMWSAPPDSAAGMILDELDMRATRALEGA